MLIDQVKAVQAWVSATNAHGGLNNCYPVKYRVLDDGGDPSRHQANVKRLVEQDHVIALVQMTAAITGQASVDYLTEKRIPVIGDNGAAIWAFNSPMYFPQMTMTPDLVRSGFAAAAGVAKAEGLTKVGVVFCVELPGCSAAYDSAPQYANEFGLQHVYRTKATVTQPDYTAVCQAAKNAGAQILGIYLDGNSMARLGRSCASVNYRPLYFSNTQALTPAVTDGPSLDGMVFANTVIPWFWTANPGVREHQEVLRQYAPGVKPYAGSIVGWVAAKLFETVTKNLSEPPTSASILEGLWALKNNDLGGLTAPLTFTKDQPPPRYTCYWTLRIQSGEFVSPNNAMRTCV